MPRMEDLYRFVSESLTAELEETRRKLSVMHRRAQEAEAKVRNERVIGETQATLRYAHDLRAIRDDLDIAQKKCKSLEVENMHLKFCVKALEAALRSHRDKDADDA